MGLNRSRIRRKAVTARLKRLSHSFQSDMAFDHWQRNQIQHCNHCGEVLNADGTCPGLCTPTERD